MTKQDQLGLLKLLSKVESVLLTTQAANHIPDIIWEQIAEYSEKLEQEILG